MHPPHSLRRVALPLVLALLAAIACLWCAASARAATDDGTLRIYEPHTERL